MALEKINNVKGKAVFVPGNDIDTDRIIPARFMVCVTFEGLGKYAFYDERKNADGTDKKHPLTDPRKQNAKILLSGENFGCGSSREHAPQSLWHYGFRAPPPPTSRKSANSSKPTPKHPWTSTSTR